MEFRGWMNVNERMDVKIMYFCDSKFIKNQIDR
jgi:hypothetical protein